MGMCYIETSNLDGETNLKIRQVCTVSHNNFINAIPVSIKAFTQFRAISGVIYVQKSLDQLMQSILGRSIFIMQVAMVYNFLHQALPLTAKMTSLLDVRCMQVSHNSELRSYGSEKISRNTAVL